MFYGRAILRSCVAVLLAASVSTALASEADAPVADAAMRGDIDAVSSLLDDNADVNSPQGDGTTALHWAAYRDDLDMAAMLLSAGANVGARTRLNDLIPMVMAAKNGNGAMVTLLLEAGTDANFADANGTSLLMYAAAAGESEAVAALLDHGADPNTRDSTNGQTATMFAAALDRDAAIRALAEAGADLDAVTKVSEVITFDQKFLNDDGTIRIRDDYESTPMGGMTALHFAARQGHIGAIRALLESGANIDSVSVADETSVLTSAIINGHLDIGSYLVEMGADPNLPNVDGQAPLYATIDARWAERTWYPAPSIDQEATDYMDLARALIERGADVNQRLEAKPWYRTEHGDWARPSGATPFWLAAKANDVPAMEMLVAAGANPAVRSRQGATPLMVAAGFGLEPQVTNFAPGERVAAVRYLVEVIGMDVTARDNNGYTPFHGAGLTENHELIMYLLAAGADPRARAYVVFGGQGREDLDVEGETGDTVADMANGPRAHNMQYPDTVALLESLGSENSNNCRASTCVIKTRSQN